MYTVSPMPAERYDLQTLPLNISGQPNLRHENARWRDPPIAPESISATRSSIWRCRMEAIVARRVKKIFPFTYGAVCNDSCALWSSWAKNLFNDFKNSFLGVIHNRNLSQPLLEDQNSAIQYVLAEIQDALSIVSRFLTNQFGRESLQNKLQPLLTSIQHLKLEQLQQQAKTIDPTILNENKFSTKKSTTFCQGYWSTTPITRLQKQTLDCDVDFSFTRLEINGRFL